MFSVFQIARQAENPRQAAYDAKLQELTESAGVLTQQKVNAIVDLLEQTRKEVVAAVASTDWDTYHNAERKAAIEAALKAWKQKAIEELSQGMETAYDTGIDVVDGPLAAAGVDLGAVATVLPDANLEVMAEYSADLITNVGDDAITKINGVVNRALVGGLSMTEAIEQIGKSLDSPGVFKSIRARAEFIARTEMARINNAARQARINQVAGLFPELKPKKKWIHSGKPKKTRRRNHYQVDGEIVPIGQKFSNGIDYPHAPGLPAKEVVNCGCTHVMVMDDWTIFEGDYSPLPYQERAT